MAACVTTAVEDMYIFLAPVRENQNLTVRHLNLVTYRDGKLAQLMERESERSGL